MPGSKHGPEIKKPHMYESLRDEGMSKEKAARISNARAEGSLDQNSTHLADRSKEELYDEAKEIGIEGRSDMSKKELIDAIRDH
ncbi:MAG TPA: Rho termination factor N-terminal domain-containing protein [Sphingomicrobium sp.]|nr:Rho termination factor N-terminal domain-containing protein [Sphingomicrobium sp.]